MRYLPANLATGQKAKAQLKAKTEKIDGSCHPPNIITKPLQAKEFMSKRGRLLGLKATPAVKPRDDAAPAAAVGKAEVKAPGPSPGTWGGALKWLPGQGRPRPSPSEDQRGVHPWAQGNSGWTAATMH